MLPLLGTFYNPTEKIWQGPEIKDIFNADLTLGELILERLRKTPHKIIQIMDTTEETLTSQQLTDYAIAMAKNFINLNLKPNDVVGLYAHNTKHVVTVMLASFLCGTPVNALYPGFDTANVSLIYKTTKPKIIFCDIENYETAKDVNKNLNLNALIYLMNGEIPGVSTIKDLLEYKKQPTNGNLETFKLPCMDFKGEDPAVILCSSGTTGTPKGVILPHRALVNKKTFHTLQSDSVLFSYSTMYWATGLLTLTSSLINGVLRIITDKPFTPEHFLYVVKHYNVTHAFGSGSQLAELILNVETNTARKSLKSIDTLMCGGSKVPEIVLDKMLKILSDNTNRPGLSIVYGMSEICGILTLNGGQPFEFCKLSEGKLCPNKKVRIVDKQGNSLGPNESGEILIASLYMFMGYYGNPEITEKSFVGNWFYSGDIGYFDDYGFLHVCGRDKDVFKSSNFQIYPQIIEELILKLPGVAEVCVVGIPDLVASNLTACAIVRTQDKNGLNLTAEDIDQYVKDNMASVYHLKGGVYFMDSIPKTASGKMQRKNVLELIHKP